MAGLHDSVILIPSLHPDHLLSEYVDKLLSSGFRRIVVVDDGSGPDEAYQSIFRSIAALDGCTVIGYETNRGKGYALKYGMEHIARVFPDAPGIVTADSDGQHTAPDVEKLAARLMEKPGSLLLGSRDFSQPNVPPKSRFGNRTTSFFFALLYGRWLPDTQTGLRAFSTSMVPFMRAVPGDRFEYEMNMLIYASNEKIPFDIVPIDTIYIAENKSTHFRAFHDSIRIYKQLFGNFFRYASASILSFLLDNGLFTLLDHKALDMVFGAALRSLDPDEYLHTLAAAGAARVLSSIFNYQMNRRYVFKAGRTQGSGLRYAALCAATLLLSAALTNFFHLVIGIDRTPVKIVVDTLLYFANYRIQKAWVFRQKIV